jgi:hypothetical protein
MVSARIRTISSVWRGSAKLILRYGEGPLRAVSAEASSDAGSEVSRNAPCETACTMQRGLSRYGWRKWIAVNEAAAANFLAKLRREYQSKSSQNTPMM